MGFDDSYQNTNALLGMGIAVTITYLLIFLFTGSLTLIRPRGFSLGSCLQLLLCCCKCHHLGA